MIIEHAGKRPHIDTSAYVAPNATICGNVTIGKNARIMFGAQIIAENSPIQIGENCIILENAVVRATYEHPVRIGSNTLIGPHAHIAGCVIEDNVFLATGTSVFHGAIVKRGSEVRVNGIVHLRTIVPENTIIPIGWIAVGDPMQVFSPDRHDEIWEIQRTLAFNKHVYGISAEQDSARMLVQLCRVMSERLAAHSSDKIVSA